MAEASSIPLYIRIRRILIVLITLLSVFLIIQICLNLFVLPRMQIGQILLESNLDISDSDLLVMGGLRGRENYISLDEREIRNNFESFPQIRKAYVEKQFPNTLKIVLYGRIPLGLTMTEGNGPINPVLFDEFGVVYKFPGSSPYRDLPLLTGISSDEGADGSVLPEALTPLLQDLKSLQKDSPLLYRQISEIRVSRQEGVLHEVRLYLSSYRLPVVLSTGLTDTLMKKILLVLDSLSSGNLMKDLEYADFRTDQVVLRTREGN